ncbi:MAG: Crp/Fnr family transcriptional regulator [Pseudopedobacter saltans]|uniref:Crp/Fnr family transcriptional regulator n=1 Tax=Pseudopedobacter saltans TaxID=151895 RepID=A0A2W5EGS4_9SPHI|nr:MAG: Crp/Fnr family transcriptional regulator [Pseudopedobacter saltans]
MHLDKILDGIHPLSSEAKSLIVSATTEVHFPKGHILFKENRYEQNVYFLKSGIARAFSTIDDGEITFWFGMQGDFIISMQNYIENRRSYETIELLEDAELYQISNKNLQNLYNQNVEIANWGRKLAEKELVKTEKRFISRQLGTATERYKELLNTYPDLMQRVALCHIASFLGITQVSLSRIRAEIR